AITGTAVTITATIRNQGLGSAAASTAHIRLGRNATGAFESDPIVCDAIATAEIAAGATLDVGCTWTLTTEAPGAAYLWMTTDVDDTAGQTNRTNDSRSTPFTVLAPAGPDLVVTRLVIRPRTIRNGQQLAIRARRSEERR